VIKSVYLQHIQEINLQDELTLDFHDELIKAMVYWIEANLSDRLTMEKASKKTGYSRWYLQRLFKSKTGYVLGKYIRDRRLTMAAIALRLTDMTILEISDYFSFDSQQTFTRTFKKNFDETPGNYRRNASWTMNGIMPPLALKAFPQPEYEFVELPAMAFVGTTETYVYPFDALYNSQYHVHHEALSRYLTTSEALSETVWGLSDIYPDSDDTMPNALQFKYTVGQQVSLKHRHNIKVPASKYMKIKYTHELSRINDFILYVYSALLPTLDLKFIMQPDLEKFSPELRLNGITCEYYIPLENVNTGRTD